ncbi:acyltransferase [Bradyrhizobium sp. SZCCHNS1054]|uniref:acyltransferase family protein n=1 Tax=Bradyrhizobium sp. SZCCHNS1054 TaxID=3057301 RepID=UPI002916D5B9|nr:acyltransferase [Bradyrhizobium sp. SZCCHNS1054]
MAASVNRKYIPEVDQLRAFAALLVLIYHCFQLIGARLAHGQDFDPSRFWVHASNPVIAVIEEGHSGVGLFIVLSGFILATGAVGNVVDYRSFLLARILRIYPMLLVCLVAAASVQPVSILNILTSLLPLNVSGGVTQSMSGMFWAVAIEFQCYLIFPFLILFSEERGTKYLVQVIILAIVLRYLTVLADGANPKDIAYWTVVGRIDQFCIGMILARLYARSNLSNLKFYWFLLATFVVVATLWIFNHLGGMPLVKLWKIWWPTVEGLMWAVFIVTYLSVGHRFPAMLMMVFTKVGEVSYSVYLVHFAVIFAAIRKSAYIRLTGNGYYDAILTALLVVAPLSILIGWLAYHTVELPFLRLRPKYLRPTQSKSVQAMVE